MADFIVNDKQTLLNVHDAGDCVPPCVIHSPLPGPWDTWVLIWRDEDMFSWYRGFERICPHGVGHPAAEYAVTKPPGGVSLVHGCDGCPCVPPPPGSGP